VLLETREMGAIEIASQEILTFTVPVLGFEAYKRFVIVPDPEAPPFNWLQSVEEKRVAFPVVRAEEIGAAYHENTHTLAQLGASGWDQVDTWVIVVIPQDGRGIFANLRAPVVVNARTRLAGQIVMREEYPVSCALIAASH